MWKVVNIVGAVITLLPRLLRAILPPRRKTKRKVAPK